MNNASRNALATLLAATLAGACGDGSTTPASSDRPPGGDGTQVVLSFIAEVDGEPFACNRKFGPIGIAGSTIEPSDLRFYVSDVRLFDAEGGEVAVELDHDGVWQLENFALLDFEDATGRCVLTGTEEMNTIVRGTAPQGEYVGVRFTLGLPFEWNHGDAATAPPPLNKTAMFWNWNAGYKFLRFDNWVEATGTEFRVHFGSTRCEGDGRGNVSGCGNPNRLEVELLDFDVHSDAVVANFGSLFVDSNVEENAPDTPPGCMGAPADPDCAAPFGRLGLPFEGRPGGEQQLFSVGRGLAEPPGEQPRPSPTPQGTVEYVWDLPPGFPQPKVPDDNPMSEAKVELGRRLFFDKRLSLNETQSCGSCHEQPLAFSDGRPVAEGSTGDMTPRNAPSLTNVAYNPTFTWMNPLTTELEEQILGPLFGEEPVELGFAGREDVLLRRFRDEPMYREMFAGAFPGEGEPITIDNITKAIASFERTLISGNSPYDRFVYQLDDDALSESARRGMDVFFSEILECDHCHGGLNFASSLTHAGNPDDPSPFENNGLYNIDGEGGYPEPNTGLHAFTGEPRDMGRMKPPTLRNIELTAPYMHDGSIETLEEVIDHYARGGRRIDSGPLAGDGALSPVKSDFITGFPLSDAAKADLIEFLKSLTDPDFITNPRFRDPFEEE